MSMSHHAPAFNTFGRTRTHGGAAAFGRCGSAGTGGSSDTSLAVWYLEDSDMLSLDPRVLNADAGFMSVTYTIVPADPGATVEDVRGDTGLGTGDNTFSFTIRAADGFTTQEYLATIHVFTPGAIETTDLTPPTSDGFTLDGTYFTFPYAAENNLLACWFTCNRHEMWQLDLSSFSDAWIWHTGAEAAYFDMEMFNGSFTSRYRVYLPTGTESPPSSAGYTLLEVPLETSDVPDVILNKIVTVLTGLGAPYSCFTVSSGVLTYTHPEPGDLNDIFTDSPNMIGSAAGLSTTQQGYLSVGPPYASGLPLITIPILPGASAADVASAIATVMGSNGYTTTLINSGLTARVQCAGIGPRPNAGDGSSGVAFTLIEDGADPI